MKPRPPAFSILVAQNFFVVDGGMYPATPFVAWLCQVLSKPRAHRRSRLRGECPRIPRRKKSCRHENATGSYGCSVLRVHTHVAKGCSTSREPSRRKCEAARIALLEAAFFLQGIQRHNLCRRGLKHVACLDVDTAFAIDIGTDFRGHG